MGHLKFLCCNWNYLFILLSLKFFVCISTRLEEDKLYYRSLIETATEEDKSGVASRSLRVFRVRWSSESGDLQSLVESGGLQSLQIFSFPCFPKALCIYILQDRNLIYTMNLHLRSCTLEYILTYQIVLWYFIIIKIIEVLYKSNFIPTKMKLKIFIETIHLINSSFYFVKHL